MRRRPVVQRAFDEARFGSANILNVREPMLSGAEATRRAEGWLRTRQVERAGELLIVTGRGNGSPGQLPVVREEIRKLLSRLRRSGVVEEFREHTAGSFAVTLAPLRALFEAPKRHRDSREVAPASASDSPPLAGLEPATEDRLRHLAEQSLAALGVARPDAALLRSEMERQFSLLVRGATRAMAPTDAWLLAAIERAIREYEDAAQ